MARFIAGFLTASAIWAVGLLGFGIVSLRSDDDESIAAPEDVEVIAEETDEPVTKRRRRRRARRPRDSTDRSAPTGNAVTGDDLGENDPRNLDLAGSGGEQQLSSGQIEAGFDESFGKIRRCLVLAAGDEPVSGRLVFGLRIRGSGEVTRVRLDGPAAVTTGEAGTCLRNAARSIRFPSFDGPEMIVRYPITLD